MSQAAIRALLEGRLNAWALAQGLPIAWENVPFTPPADAYLRAFMLPGQSRTDDLASKVTTYVGLMQIDVAVPSGNGPAVAETLVHGLEQQFPSALRLSDGAITVTLTGPLSAGPSIPDDSHYIVPTSLTYRADI